MYLSRQVASTISSITVILLSSLLIGCSTKTQLGNWGESATITPGWNRFTNSVRNAATSPKTWAPLAIASISYITDADERVSNWAVENKPVFGKSAPDASSDLRQSATDIYRLTVLITPSGNNPQEWIFNKAKGITVGAAAIATVGEITDFTKETAGRTRPNGENTRSFISGHASSTAIHTELATQNIYYLDTSPLITQATAWGLYGLNAASAWSRVESGSHYPSDVLASMAVGNFISIIFHQTFMPHNNSSDIYAYIEEDGTYMFKYTFRY